MAKGSNFNSINSMSNHNVFFKNRKENKDLQRHHSKNSKSFFEHGNNTIDETADVRETDSEDK